MSGQNFELKRKDKLSRQKREIHPKRILDLETKRGMIDFIDNCIIGERGFHNSMFFRVPKQCESIMLKDFLLNPNKIMNIDFMGAKGMFSYLGERNETTIQFNSEYGNTLFFINLQHPYIWNYRQLNNDTFSLFDSNEEIIEEWPLE